MARKMCIPAFEIQINFVVKLQVNILEVERNVYNKG